MDSDGKYVDNNTVSVNISRLRTKIEDDISKQNGFKQFMQSDISGRNKKIWITIILAVPFVLVDCI